MSVKFPNSSRNTTSRSIKSIIKGQRASCKLRIFRWQDPNMIKLQHMNVSSDQSISGRAQAATTGNVNAIPHIVEIESDIISCVVNKNKSGSSGTFSIVLKRGKETSGGKELKSSINYLKVVNPGDWVAIYLKKSAEINFRSVKADSGLKLLGIIENIRYLETDDPQSGTPKLEFHITGRDFGKVFDMDIFFNPIVNQQTIQTILGAKFLADSSQTVNGIAGFTPDTIIKELVSFYLGGKLAQYDSNNQSWYIPPTLGQIFGVGEKAKSSGVSFVDLLDTSKIGMHKYNKNSNFIGVGALLGASLITALPSNGTVWSILQHLQNSVLNEMYTELAIDSSGNLRPSLILRQVPFSNYENQPTSPFYVSKNYGSSEADKLSSSEKTYFATLPRIEVPSTDIKSKNVGRSDHERVNHVIVVPKFINQTFEIAYMVGLNTPSIQRHGLKSFQFQTSYVLGNTPQGANNGIQTYLEKCVNLIEDWFFLAHNFYNGTVLADGADSHVAVGMNLYIPDMQQLYHIDGYTHSYSLSANGIASYQTEYRVTRGQWFDKNSGKCDFIESVGGNNAGISVITNALEYVRTDYRNR